MKNYIADMDSKQQLMAATVVSIFIGTMLMSADAVALTTENNITQDFMTQFRTRMVGISANITRLMTYTFFGLITIEFVYAMGLAAMQDKGIQGIFSEFIAIE